MRGMAAKKQSKFFYYYVCLIVNMFCLHVEKAMYEYSYDCVSIRVIESDVYKLAPTTLEKIKILKVLEIFILFAFTRVRNVDC